MVLVPRSFIPAVALPPTSPFATASVDLNFATGTYVGGSLGSLISVSNSSGGYVTNADGTLTSIAANTPRIGAGSGLLVEESRTNIVTYSSDPAGQWNWGRVTVTANTIAAPDGTITADTVTDDTNTNSHYVSAGTAPTVTPNTTYTHSIYVKPGGGPTGGRYIQLGLSAYNNTGYCFAGFDIVAGTVLYNQAGGSGGVFKSATATLLANGWCRITLSAIPDATDTAAFITVGMGVAPGTAPANYNYTGTGTSYFYFWGDQVELGAFATSYIATTSATVVRQWDNVTSAGALTTALNGAASVYMETSGTLSVAANSYAYFFDAVTSGQPQAYFQNVGQLYLSGTGGNSSLSYTGTPYTGFLKSAFAWDATGSSVSSAGLLGTISAAMTLPSTGNWAIANYSSGSYPQDGYIPRLTVWNSRLPNTTLTGLTT